MPSLQIRELPEYICEKLRAEAEKEHRSFSQQAVATIERGLRIGENPKERRQEVLQNIAKHPVVPNGAELVDPVKLVREERER